jgi:hypothetical protein
MFAEDLAAAREVPMERMRELRAAGATRRGLGDEFYRLVAEVIRGKPYPVAALAEMQAVDRSTASRWISGARSRGLLS